VTYQHKLRNYTHRESLDMKDCEHPNGKTEPVPKTIATIYLVAKQTISMV